MLEKFALKDGNNIIHEGSGMGSSATDIKQLCSGAIVESGLAIRGGSVCREKIKMLERGICAHEFYPVAGMRGTLTVKRSRRMHQDRTHSVK